MRTARTAGMRPRAAACVALAAALVLAACSAEKPQQLGAKKTGTPSWQGTNDGYAVPGWTPGDQTSWETQMRNRAQRGQNEYGRIAPG